MKIIHLDKEFRVVQHIEAYDSFIWTERYCAYGDFEIHMPASRAGIEQFALDHYIMCDKSERIMIIESMSVETGDDENQWVKITGRSAESILERRIVWKQTNLNGSVSDAIERLLLENIIYPEMAEREISRFNIWSVYLEQDYPKVDAQYTGDNLYEVIKGILAERGIGFEVILASLPRPNTFGFRLHEGEDRSYAQSKNPYVVFSPEMDNFSEGEYLKTNMQSKSVALVAGEGEGTDRKTVTVGEALDIERREIFVDARDLSSETEDGKISAEEYAAMLKDRGKKELAEKTETCAFSPEVGIEIQEVYGRDYFLGDIVQFKDAFGNSDSARVEEVIFCEDAANGFTITPTIAALNRKEEDYGKLRIL